MGILPGFRGNGYGSQLLSQAIGKCQVLGLEKIELEVFRSNIGARKLYEKFGFTRDGVKPKARKLDGNYDDIFCMSLFV
jgi:ribosomal protein S18 acetylase RimI-like enzyme